MCLGDSGLGVVGAIEGCQIALVALGDSTPTGGTAKQLQLPPTQQSRAHSHTAGAREASIRKGLGRVSDGFGDLLRWVEGWNSRHVRRTEVDDCSSRDY